MKKKKHKNGTCECAELRAWAALYVEGETPEVIKQHLLLHIQNCRSCAKLVRSLQRTVNYCRLETDCEVPDQAHEKLWHLLERHLKSRK
ncbi:MAG: anti-sigma factor family protein [bacterium]